MKLANTVFIQLSLQGQYFKSLHIVASTLLVGTTDRPS
ncbi:hypothetical protein LLB_2474 [Legionella longbeachae D-4968]|nr:hypothetical protein LLB_2474 [Legionella longbeachae D-4968]